MTDERWAAVDELVGASLVRPEPALAAALEAGRAAGLPGIEVSPAQGKLLALLVRIRGARRVLELGTLAGYSTIWLARALPPGGRLVTLELDPRYAEVATANVEHAGLGDVVDVRVGRALDTLAELADEGAGPFDLVFVDADKRSYPDYLPWVLRLSAPGTLIIADNVVRRGAVLAPAEDDPSSRGARRFLELLAAEARVDATVLQTVGVKGWDGLALALVTG